MIPDNMNARAACNELLSSLRKLKEVRHLLNKSLSTLDLELSNVYHTIETVPMNPFQTHRVNLYLRHILSERRDVKNELVVMNSFTSSSVGLEDKMIINLEKALKLKPLQMEPEQRHRDQLAKMLAFELPVTTVVEEVAATLEVEVK